jgi:hypothetical protein
MHTGTSNVILAKRGLWLSDDGLCKPQHVGSSFYDFSCFNIFTIAFYLQLLIFRYFYNFLSQYTSPLLCPSSFEETQHITKKCITIANCSETGVENYFDSQATSPASVGSTDNKPTST